jgi:enoyl-CoA hydratase
MFEVSDESGVRTITMNHPPVNAVSSQSYRDLVDLVAETNTRDDINVVIFVSALPGRFSAGADINEVVEILGDSSSASDERRQELARAAYDSVRTLAQPSIAVIEGVALGAGAVLASVCDMRIASSDAHIGLPEITVGRCGGARHLSRYLPPGRIRRMYFTGVPIDAHTAEAFGLFDEVTEPGKAYEAAHKLALEISSNSPLALRLAKRALNESEFENLSEGYAIEQTYTVQLGRSADAKEAISAFLDKRKPVWVGR